MVTKDKTASYVNPSFQQGLLLEEGGSSLKKLKCSLEQQGSDRTEQILSFFFDQSIKARKGEEAFKEILINKENYETVSVPVHWKETSDATLHLLRKPEIHFDQRRIKGALKEASSNLHRSIIEFESEVSPILHPYSTQTALNSTSLTETFHNLHNASRNFQICSDLFLNNTNKVESERSDVPMKELIRQLSTFAKVEISDSLASQSFVYDFDILSLALLNTCS